MGWLQHRHYWRPKTDVNRLIDPETQTAISCFILEDCACGAVRQIEFSPGEAPKIRIGVVQR